ncbi:NPEPPS (predicted) [Pycnogonum litorale]
MLELYRKSDLQEEKNRIGGSLGSVNDEKLIGRVLDFSVSKEVRTQDCPFILLSASVNSVKSREKAWNFFKDNKDEIRQKFSSGHLIGLLVKYLTENFAMDDKHSEVKDFFEKNPFPSTERSVAQALESISINKQWLERDREQIKLWLSR